MTGATATGGYRCCCGSSDPSFVLSIIPRRFIGEMPEFKLRMPVADSASSSGVVIDEETLCGYVASNLEGGVWNYYCPARFYRLVYRRGKNGNGDGTLSPALNGPHDDDVDAEQEERRLLATEESRQRYSSLRW